MWSYRYTPSDASGIDFFENGYSVIGDYYCNFTIEQCDMRNDPFAWSSNRWFAGTKKALGGFRFIAQELVPKRQFPFFLLGPASATIDTERQTERQPELRYEVERRAIHVVNSLPSLEAMRQHVFSEDNDSERQKQRDGSETSSVATFSPLTSGQQPPPGIENSPSSSQPSASAVSYNSNGDLDHHDESWGTC